MFSAVALFEQLLLPGYGLRAAIEQSGRTVIDLDHDAARTADLMSPTTALRAPAGLLAHALWAGAQIALTEPTTAWFVALPESVTGRTWHACTPPEARRLIARQPTFVKLAGSKHRGFPAQRFASLPPFGACVRAVGGSEALQLLATTEWLPIESEYRTFTVGRDVLTCSPYRVEDEPWSPLLYSHRASFHDEARDWAASLLASLEPRAVPPAAVLDVARLADGRYVLLEANKPWASGIYSCDPHAALQSVLAANGSEADSHWRWRPDPELRYVPGGWAAHR